MSEELTKKQKGFIKDYVKTGNGTQAVLDNYDVNSENSAAVIATQNLRKVKVQEAIKSIADRIPDELLEKVHLEASARRRRRRLKKRVVEMTPSSRKRTRSSSERTVLPLPRAKKSASILIKIRRTRWTNSNVLTKAMRLHSNVCVVSPVLAT